MAMLGRSSSKLQPVFRAEYSSSSYTMCRLPVMKSWGKRVFSALARAVHDKSILFSTLVRIFRALQRCGINFTPNHFYWPIPNIAELERREWQTFESPVRCPFRLERQLELAREFAKLYGAEYRFDSRPLEHSYHYGNGYFESCDAEVAYCMVRHWKPHHIVEIGSGYSSRIMAAALRSNMEHGGVVGELLSIDPDPERVPRNGLGDMVTVIAKPVQHLETRMFAMLQPDDILFIDSSHVVGVGSDVTHVYLQILPAIPPGVVVHVHDIFLPYDYPRDAVLKNLWFWSEQYLLQAFLSFNTEFEVLWSASAIQSEHPDLLELCFPHWRHSYSEMPEAKRHFIPTRDHDHIWPSSFWIRRLQHQQPGEDAIDSQAKPSCCREFRDV
jgi:predicted O-methyltransferase YrrM